MAEPRWYRIRFSLDQIAGGSVLRLMHDLLPLAVHVSDLNGVALFSSSFEVGDPRSTLEDVYFTPRAALAFAEIVAKYGAAPCDRPAAEGLSLLYGDASVAWNTLGH
jgi:hypothetical protein